MRSFLLVAAALPVALSHRKSSLSGGILDDKVKTAIDRALEVELNTAQGSETLVSDKHAVGENASDAFLAKAELITAPDSEVPVSESNVVEEHASDASAAKVSAAGISAAPVTDTPLATANTSDAMAAEATTAGFVAADQNLTCMRNTGGTCHVMGCPTWHGFTECRQGKCMCSGLGCAGSDGKCHRARVNKLLTSEGFKLRSALWPGHYLSAPGMMPGSLTMSTSEPVVFQLYQLPAEDMPGEFVLSHKNEANSAVTSTSYGSYVSNVSSYMITDVAVKLFKAPSYDKEPEGLQSVVIESFKYRGFYLEASSSKAGFSQGEKGAGSYWIPEPALPEGILTNFSGMRCQENCAGYNAAR